MVKAPTSASPRARAAKKAPPKSNGLFMLGFVALFASVILLIVSMASLVLLVFGLLPTFVAVLVDRSPQRFAFFSVFAMNFAGIFPYLLDLWMGSNSLSVAIDSLTDVFSLFTMYGAAALGWVLFAVTPPIVTTVMTIIAQRRVSILRARQKKLVEEWGEEITNEDLHEFEGADKSKKSKTKPKKEQEPGAPKAPGG